MKKLSFFLILALLCGLLIIPGGAASMAVPDKEITAQGVYLYNIENDALIYEKNPDQRMPPASLTKVMTCILALEHTSDLDNTTLTYPNYVQDYLYNYQYVQGHGRVSLGGLEAGEQLTMRQALYALMLPSANEAAMIIADHIARAQPGFGEGDDPQAFFAEMMNQRARELGCQNTNFVNANGLFEENHYSSPRDMALMTLHAKTLPFFMDIVTTTSYPTTTSRKTLTWETTNKMMVEGESDYYAAVRGIKTGSVPESGYCFISSATRDGFEYLLVVMGSDMFDDEGERLSQNMAFSDTYNLYDWVFRNFKRQALVEKGKYVEEVPLRLSAEKDYLQVMTADRFTALVHNNVSSVTMIYDLPDFINAPVQKNEIVGSVTLVLAGEEIGKVDLLAAESIAASTPLVILDKIRQTMGQLWFKFAVIFVLLLVVAYFVLAVVRNRGRRRYGGYKPRRRL